MPEVHAAPAKRLLSARELLALNVIRLRGEKGWSQDALAAEVGLHRTFVAHVERQKRNISIDNVERLAVALGRSVSQLFEQPPATVKKRTHSA